MPEGRYQAADVEALESVEAVRRRPGMFVGPTSKSAAVNALVLEPLCLAVDLHTGGPAQRVVVRLLSKDVAEIWNDGPGLPLGRNAAGVSFVEIIMTRVYGCRAHKADEANKKWCHAGIVAANALSAWCRVTVERDGGKWSQRFVRGTPRHDLKRIGDSKKTGTTIRFKVDRTMLTGAFSARALRKALREFTDDVPCTKVVFEDYR